MVSTSFLSPMRAPQRASMEAKGAALMFSVPPQTTTSESPARMERAPSMTDFMPEPQTMPTV